MKLNTVKLRSIIYESGSTQTALAKVAGVSRGTFTMVCNGKKCNEETAKKIAAALGVKLEELTE